MMQQNFTERGMAVGLRALNRLASNPLIDRFGLRDPAQRVLHTASKATVRTATRAGRTFAATQKLSTPARQPRTGRSDLFDLTPDDEQQMLRESVRDFALAKLRPAARDADEACAAPGELLAQANELGLTMVGVPEELGGAVAERSAVTTVLMAEALAQGDMGIAVACLAPAGVSTALSLWGDADQQATYLPEFVGENVPAAALALLEPRPLFNPFELQTRARRAGGGFVLDGVKSLVPRAADAELFIVAAELVDEDPARPALFIVEPGTAGLAIEPEPAMGLRAAATGRLIFEDVKLAPRRAARRRRSREVIDRVRPAQPARLVRGRGRDGSGGARLRDPVRERAQGVRRADLLAPVGGVHGREHRDRARRHATGHLPRRQSRRPGPAVRPRGRAGPAAVLASAAWRSAPTACRCSAVTATPRSTRSSAGTATCGPPA